MGRQMDANPDYRQLYLRLLTDPHAIRHYLNLKLRGVKTPLSYMYPSDSSEEEAWRPGWGTLSRYS